LTFAAREIALRERRQVPADAPRDRQNRRGRRGGALEPQLQADACFWRRILELSL